MFGRKKKAQKREEHQQSLRKGLLFWLPGGSSRLDVYVDYCVIRCLGKTKMKEKERVIPFTSIQDVVYTPPTAMRLACLQLITKEMPDVKKSYWYAYENFKEVEFELGLVPVPLGPNGTEYSTINGSWRRMLCIPTTNTEPERAGAIIQAATLLNEINNDLANQDIKNKTYAHDENAYKVYEMVSKLGFYEYAVYETGFGELMGIPSEAIFVPEASISSILEAKDSQMSLLVDEVYNKK